MESPYDIRAFLLFYRTFKINVIANKLLTSAQKVSASIECQYPNFKF